MGAGRVLAGTAKKAAKPLGEMFLKAVPEALGSGALTFGTSLLFNQPLDEALTYGVTDTLASIGSLGLLNKAGVKNNTLRTVANVGTGVVANRIAGELLFADRYEQPGQQVLQGQGGQPVTNAQQQGQRAAVNGMTMDDIAGKYMEETMFQQLQGALNGGTSQAEMVQMMNSLGPTYDMNAARRQMASIMDI